MAGRTVSCSFLLSPKCSPKLIFLTPPPTHRNMALNTNATTLAALQTSILQGIQIDSPDAKVNTTMNAILQNITTFVNTPDNHNTEAFEDFKKLEKFITEQRRILSTKVTDANKQRTKDANAEKKRLEKEQKEAKAAATKAQKKAEKEKESGKKNALLKLNKLLQKPKSTLGRKSTKDQAKWALVGAKKNLRSAKKILKDAENAQRKLANAGKPKNANYSRFCSWLKASQAEIEAVGAENKRDYNKIMWDTGLVGLAEFKNYSSWNEFRTSTDVPW